MAPTTQLAIVAYDAAPVAVLEAVAEAPEAEPDALLVDAAPDVELAFVAAPVNGLVVTPLLFLQLLLYSVELNWVFVKVTSAHCSISAIGS